MNNLVQAALGVLTGKCEPLSAVSKQKTRECDPKSETIERDSVCTADKPVVHAKTDGFDAADKTVVVKETVPVTALPQEVVAEKGWLDSFKDSVIAKLQALPKAAKAQIKEASENLAASVKCIGDSCKLVVTAVASQVQAIVPKCISQLVESGSKLLSSMGTSIGGAFSSLYSGVGSVYDTIYGACKSIYDTCTSIFKSLFCNERREEERRQEETRYEQKLEDKRYEDRRLVRKQEEAKQVEKKEEVRRVEKAKEIAASAVRNKVEFQLIEALPIARTMYNLQSQISAAMTDISQEIAKLSGSSTTAVWQTAKSINGKIAKLNTLSSELNHKQKAYENEIADFNRSAQELANLRHRVSYNA